MVEIIKKGWNVHITHHWKNVNGGMIRICWEATFQMPDTCKRLSSRWKGFRTPQQAINDMVKKVNKFKFDKE